MVKATVIGAGSWGTAFAGVLANNVDTVSLWCHSLDCAQSINISRRSNRYLTGYELPGNVSATNSYEEGLRGSELVVLAIPSVHLRTVCAELKPYIAQDIPVLVLTKGIEPNTGYLMNEVVADELGNLERVCALSGPNHAEEVCRGAYSAAVCAGPNDDLSQSVRSAICTSQFRVYVSSDVRGVEVCGATKNVIAIACGICAGLGFGDNTLAVLMTRGIAEIGRMVNVLGGDPITCMGLAGMGDLIATCTSKHSRNRSFGEAFIKGTSLSEYESATHMVVEGARACISVLELAKKNNVEVPVVEAIWNLLYNDMAIDQVIKILTDRTPTEEFYGMN